jgi:hypothetical protein
VIHSTARRLPVADVGHHLELGLVNIVDTAIARVDPVTGIELGRTRVASSASTSSWATASSPATTSGEGRRARGLG